MSKVMSKRKAIVRAQSAQAYIDYLDLRCDVTVRITCNRGAVASLARISAIWRRAHSHGTDRESSIYVHDHSVHRG